MSLEQMKPASADPDVGAHGTLISRRGPGATPQPDPPGATPPPDPPSATPTLDSPVPAANIGDVATVHARDLRAVDPVHGLRVIPRDEYAALEPFARGGIGRILRARDRNLHRPVALKELLSPSRRAEQRFVREALLTARLQHPGIVPSYQAGRWPSGEPFYAMKLVAGRSLAERIEAATSFHERLALLPRAVALADAVAYAHSQRIIHRDLKPENVLLGDFGETVVIDWGLAKDLSAPETDAPDLDEAHPQALSTDSRGLTVVGTVMGTPVYMPPEQASGEPVDERADVYSLGAILYHLIAGAPPFSGASAAEILLQVTGEGPRRIEEVQPGIPRELATIIRKAMSQRPEDRYPSARELADDLRRFQAGQLVASHHYGAAERLRRLIRRYRAPLAGAAAALALVAVVGVVSVRQIVDARDIAEAALAEAERHADALAYEHARVAAPTQPTRALELLAGLHDTRAWRRTRMIAADADARDRGVELRGHLAGISRLTFSADSREIVTTSDDCTARVWDLGARTARTLVGHTDEVWRAAYSPDGRTLATSSRDATVRVWDLATGAERRVLREHTRGARALMFAGDGSLISGGDDDRLLRWDVASGETVELARCRAGSFDHDGDRLVCVDLDERGLTVFDLAGGLSYHLDVPGGMNSRYELVPQRDEVIFATFTNVERWSWSTDEVSVLGLIPMGLRSLSVAPDGRTLALAGSDHEIVVWSEAGPSAAFPHSGGLMRRLEFSPNGGELYAAGADRLVHAIRLEDGHRRELSDFTERTSFLAVSPDGRLLAGASYDGGARVWSLGRREHRLGGKLRAAAIDAEQRTIYTAETDGLVRSWALADGELDAPRRSFRARDVPIASLASLSDERLLLQYVDGEAHIHGTDGARLETLPPLPQGAVRLLPSPDFRYVAASVRAASPSSYVWDLRAGTRRNLANGERFNTAWLDDHTLAIASDGTSVVAHDLDTGAETPLIQDFLRLGAIAVSDDRRYVLAGGQSHLLHVLDRQTGEKRQVQLSNISSMMRLTVIPGTTRVLVVSELSKLEIWDFVALRRVGSLQGSGSPPSLLSSAPSGMLLSQAEDYSIRLWDLEGEESRGLGAVSGNAYELFYTPSSHAVAFTADGVFIWDDHLPFGEAALTRWLERAQTATAILSTTPDERPACAPLGERQREPRGP